MPAWISECMWVSKVKWSELSEWVSEWRHGWVSEWCEVSWMSKSMSEWVSEWSEVSWVSWMHEWVKAWVSELSEVKWGEVSWVSEWQYPTIHRALTASCLLPYNERSFKEISQKNIFYNFITRGYFQHRHVQYTKKSVMSMERARHGTGEQLYSSKKRTPKGSKAGSYCPQMKTTRDNWHKYWENYGQLTFMLGN